MIFALAGEAVAPTGAGPVEASRDSLPFCRALERFPGSLRARNSARSWRQCPRDSPDCHPTEGHRRTRACRFRPTPRHNLPARCQPKDPARIHGQSGLVSTCRSGSGLHRELWAREAWCFGSYGSVGSWPRVVILRYSESSRAVNVVTVAVDCVSRDPGNALANRASRLFAQGGLRLQIRRSCLHGAEKRAELPPTPPPRAPAHR